MTAKVEIDAVQMEKLRMDLLDSLDEEIETELEDRDDVAALLMRQAHRPSRAVRHGLRGMVSRNGIRGRMAQ
ncbi:MAG: hypothetical protein ACO28I_01515 [Limnohabitans sp.]